ncbi:MAG: M24 family metallopeptidase, partial [Alphaproteobacteria bacterium]
MPPTHPNPAPAATLRGARAYRLARVREQLRARDYAGCVLFDPLNIRYATDSRNMSIWTMHNAARYCFVATEGPVIVFDFHNCDHLSDGLETVDEVRPARAWYYFAAGSHVTERANIWAAEIADLVRTHGGGNTRLAIDQCNPEGATALAREGIEIHNGQEVLEHARVIKSADELVLMKAAVDVCQTGMAQMREALTPGMSENELWSILHQANITGDGEWIETRLLSSGERTNPWFQECSNRIIQKGDMVSFDTDLIGPYGYCADISRTFLCGTDRANAEQQRLYHLAWEQIQHNTALLRPGLTMLELAERAFPLSDKCAPNRYSVVIHGVGLCDEYPCATYVEDMEAFGYDARLETGMTVCVESYMGEVGGAEGVKLEQQVLITDDGTE